MSAHFDKHSVLFVPVVDEGRCWRCMACVRACERSVLKIINSGVKPDESQTCQNCGHCVDACRYSAIRIIARDVRVDS